MYSTAYKCMVVQGEGELCGKCRLPVPKVTYAVMMFLPKADTSNVSWCWQCFMSWAHVNGARIFCKTEDQE